MKLLLVFILGTTVLVLGTPGASPQMSKERPRVAYTDPRTGITTFKAPTAADAQAGAASDPAPSTATSLAPTPAPSQQGMLPSQQFFAPSPVDLNPQVRFDPQAGWLYDYSPQELAQLGYQYVAPSTTTQRGRFGGDDLETRDFSIPGYYIDPSRNAPFYQSRDEDSPRARRSPQDLWRFSTVDRSSDGREINYKPLVVDPYKTAGGNWRELQKYGVWQNLGDPNSPLYEQFNQRGVMPTPQQMADTILGSGALGLRTTPEEWQAALGNANLPPEVMQGIRGTLAKNYQDATSGPGFLEQAFPILVGGALAFMTGGAGAPAWLAGAAGGAGGAAAAGGDTNDVLKGAAFGAAGGAASSYVGGTPSASTADDAAAAGSASASGAELSGLSDAELADILAGGSGDLTALTGGGMLSGGAAALRDLSAKTGIPTSALQRATQFGLNYAQTGDPREAAIGTGISAGASAVAPYVSRAADYLFPSDAPATPSTATSFADASDPLKRQGMLPLLAQADTGTMTDVDTMMADALGISPDKTIAAPFDLAQESSDAAMAQTLGISEPDKALAVPFDAFGASLPENFLNGPGPSEQPKPPTPDEQRIQQGQQTVERFAKFGRALAQLHGGQGQPQDAPQRQDGQTDDQYAQSLVDYAAPMSPNLSAESLAAQGLTPGTPAYYQYVMDQMDSVINRVTGGLDANGKPEDLAGQLRTKTREELNALERALFIRGQMGQLMGSGKYLDPFSGTNQDVIVPNGMLTNPARAAYQRGLAESAMKVGNLAPDEARQYVSSLVNRTPDLYGMQARADQRRQLEELLAQDDPMKRRRGLFGDSANPFFSGLDPQDLAALQALLG